MPPKKTTTSSATVKKPSTTSTTTKKPATTTTTKKTTTTTTKSTTVKKTDTKKVDPKKKKEEPKEKEEQKQEQQEKPEEKQEEEQKKQDIVGSAQVKYNHYNEFFPITNGQMKWTEIDDKYCISFVFEGNFQKHLVKVGETKNLEQKDFPTDQVDDDGKPITETIFYGVEDKQQYKLVIVEDEEAENQREHVGYKAPEQEKTETRGEGCSCLFGNPCQDKYVCQDWNNREAVAKKNGWKGFS